MSSLSVEQMRKEIEKAYPGDKWKHKVAKMSNGQILAIYNSFREKGKLEVING